MAGLNKSKGLNKGKGLGALIATNVEKPKKLKTTS